MLKRLQHYLITKLTKHLLVYVSDEQLLQEINRKWILGKNALSQEEAMLLREEAQALKESLLWKMMQQELTWLSNQKMFEHARTENDMIFGKAMLYNQALQNKFIDRLSKL